MSNQELPVVYVTEAVLAESARLLASFADREDSEGVVYWFGFEMGDCAVVTTLIVPEAEAREGYVRTSAAANAEVLMIVVRTPLVLLGQAHSHPSTWVDHSWVDDHNTFAQFPGALSVVVPHYGRGGFQPDSCGVHRHIDGQYRRIERTNVKAHLRVIPGVRDLRGGKGA